jgi:hypothetical protein
VKNVAGGASPERRGRLVTKKAVIRMPEIIVVASVLLMGADRAAKILDVTNWLRGVLAGAVLMVAEYDAVSLVVIKAPEIRQLGSVALMEAGESATNPSVGARRGLTRISVLLMVVDHDV